MECLEKMTQPVIIEETSIGRVLRHTEVEYEVLHSLPQLVSLCTYFSKPEMVSGDSLILKVDSFYTACQAADAIMNLREKQPMEHGVELDECEDEDSHWDLDDDFDEQNGGGYGDLVCGGSDYFIVEQSYFEEKDPEELQKLMLKSMNKPAVDTEGVVEYFHNLIIFGAKQSKKKELEKLLNKKKYDHIIICLPKTVEADNFALQLQFEYGFDILEVKGLELADEIRILTTFLNHQNLNISDIIWEPIIQQLKRFRKNMYCEKDLYRFAEIAIDKMKKRGEEKTLLQSDFAIGMSDLYVNPKQKLKNMIGLQSVKVEIEKAISEKSYRAKLEELGVTLSKRGKHLAFAGNPGTGKSEIAGIYYGILEEQGIFSGPFIRAGRSDMVGKYVGHTAPKIRKLFERAKGGVLFIDEAGFLLGEDEFVKEAVIELVRYMEECSDTTVIFASYPDKIKKLQELDPGMNSRIGRVIAFPDYEIPELIQIFQQMLRNGNMHAEEGYEYYIKKYAQQKMEQKESAFGNAREMRNLLNVAFQNCCYRMYQNHAKAENIIKLVDFQKALEELPKQKKSSHTMGFVLNKQENMSV